MRDAFHNLEIYDWTHHWQNSAVAICYLSHLPDNGRRMIAKLHLDTLGQTIELSWVTKSVCCRCRKKRLYWMNCKMIILQGNTNNVRIANVRIDTDSFCGTVFLNLEIVLQMNTAIDAVSIAWLLLRIVGTRLQAQLSPGFLPGMNIVSIITC